MRGGTWNMERDRDEDAAAVSALALMRSRELDFLCVQECAGYLHALHTWAGPEFAVISFREDPGRAESALIVRADVEHAPGYQVKATRAGWITVRGGKTPPKYLTISVVAGLRVVSGHTAPSVAWRGGRMLGPVRRVLSMRQFARACVRLAKAHPGPLLIACDWNATPEARGRYSPHWIARKAGLRVAAPGKGTHGPRVIDFALYRDCGVTARREKRRGSDHFAVTFKVGP
jgi:hypothetical protein